MKGETGGGAAVAALQAPSRDGWTQGKRERLSKGWCAVERERHSGRGASTREWVDCRIAGGGCILMCDWGDNLIGNGQMEL